MESLKGVQHVILLSQLSVYKGSSGIQAIMESNARKLAEQDESVVTSSGIPYTIIRSGSLRNTPGGQQGFSFKEVVNGEEKVLDWNECFTSLMDKVEQRLL